MQTVLVTGFEPFDGERIDSSWEVVKQLNDLQLGRIRIVARQLPCVFYRSLEQLNAAIDELKPVLILAVGQAGGRTDISLERVAINMDDAQTPDSEGNQPIDLPIIAGAPAAYFTRLPVKTMISGLRDAGIPVSVSQTAGTSVGNHLMYGLLHRLAQAEMSAVKGGLIHIPYLPEQAAEHPGSPSMCTHTVLTALELAIAIAMNTDPDLTGSAGGTR
jgi:pyroglutamyl-peptidase